MQHISNTLFNYIEAKSSQKGYIIKLITLCVLLICFFSTPKLLTQGLQVFETEWWHAVIRKSHNLLDPLTDIDPTHHAAKKVFRLTVPGIAYLFHLNELGIFLLQFFCGIGLLVIVYRISIRDTGDAVISTFMVFGCSWVYFGKACFVDVLSTFDGISFLLLLLAMFARKMPLIFLWSFLAAWNDERAFIALFLVLLYHQSIAAGSIQLKVTKASSAIILAGFSYLIIRFFLMKTYGLQTPNGAVGIEVLLTNLPLSGLGIWTAFEGFWILIVAFCIIMYNQSVLVDRIIYAITLIVFILLGLIIFDITRGESYLFPMIFIVIPFLKII